MRGRRRDLSGGSEEEEGKDCISFCLIFILIICLHFICLVLFVWY